MSMSLNSSTLVFTYVYSCGALTLPYNCKHAKHSHTLTHATHCCSQALADFSFVNVVVVVVVAAACASSAATALEPSANCDYLTQHIEKSGGCVDCDCDCYCDVAAKFEFIFESKKSHKVISKKILTLTSQ